MPALATPTHCAPRDCAVTVVRPPRHAGRRRSAPSPEPAASRVGPPAPDPSRRSDRTGPAARRTQCPNRVSPPLAAPARLGMDLPMVVTGPSSRAYATRPPTATETPAVTRTASTTVDGLLNGGPLMVDCSWSIRHRYRAGRQPRRRTRATDGALTGPDDACSVSWGCPGREMPTGSRCALAHCRCTAADMSCPPTRSGCRRSRRAPPPPHRR